MVNVFIVHSGSDYDYVKRFVEPYLKGRIDEQGNRIDKPAHKKIRILTLESKGKIWKSGANKKIKEAQVIIFVMGKDACQENKRETIGWEIKQAYKYQKMIMLFKIDSQYQIPDYFFKKDHFTLQEHPIAEPMTLQQIKRQIERFDAGEYEIFSPWFQNLEDRSQYMDKVMEQYKLYQQSSEELVNRRQNVNSFYQALNGVLITALAAMLGLSGSDSISVVPTYINPQFAVVLIAAVGFILDCSWIRLLDSYGKLNSAKMKVLNLLERNLPIEMYRVEWDVMTDRLNNKPYKSFTTTEKWIPRIFCALYLMVAAWEICSAILH